MATTSTASSRPGRSTPPSSRRASSSLSTSPPNSISKGATARSAASAPRVSSSLNSSVVRRPSVKGPTSKSPTPSALNGESQETLSASLKEETEQKEQLLVQLQTKDQTISTLTAENNNFQSALNAAETRLNEFYADQSRMEEEMAARIEVAEKLRTQVRELEKEKRDVQRRYNEQTATFDAERQAAYDNEQHLKSRIQSLTQVRQQPEPPSVPLDTVPLDIESESETEPDEEVVNHETSRKPPESNQQQDLKDPEQEPAEMTSLKLELSTLSTSYSSLQSTLILLQTQLVDLKRVNHELQEENESYMILLREKTLSGQFDVMRQVGASPITEDEDEEDDDMDVSGDITSTSSIARSTLHPVEEEITTDSFEQELERSLEQRDTDSQSQSSRNARPPSKHPRKRVSSTSHSPSGTPRGESLAGLPLTGPGLDLAAELGRAENKDVLDGGVIDDRDRSVLNAKGKRGKKSSSEARRVTDGLEPINSPNDVDALRTEVKSLKDANKALSLYASKIIDRIISQEGFEHVLAVDFDKPSTPTTAGPTSPVKHSVPVPKARPQSAIFGTRSSSNPTPTPLKQDRLTTFSPPPTSPNPDAAAAKRKSQRRSLSFDWKSFSMFGGTEKKPDNPSLRPLTLKPGAAPVTGLASARKLDTEEDDEDKRERDRLQATMKLMGIETPTTVASPTLPTATPFAVPTDQGSSTSSSPPQPTGGGRSRWSFFGGTAPRASSEASSIHSAPSIHGSPRPSVGDERPSNLTQEALAHAEAENSLAALDAHEQVLSAEIARGAGGGFTEIARRGTVEGRRSRRSRTSGAGSGSGSTVWSAGIADEGED